MPTLIIFFHTDKHGTWIRQYNTVEISVYDNIASHCICSMNQTVGKSFSQCNMSCGCVIPHLIIIKTERHRQGVLQ